MNDLKPCPFCGSDDLAAELDEIPYGQGSAWFVRCECGAEQFGRNETQVIDRWNSRHHPTCQTCKHSRQTVKAIYCENPQFPMSSIAPHYPLIKNFKAFGCNLHEPK